MKRLLAFILALLCLTSCASMLERETTYTAAHVENPPGWGDTGYRVNTYLGLCAALQSYVEEGMLEGNLRFPATYPGNLTVDLEKAKRQLMEEEALGCYVLGDVTFHISRIVAYYEVTATFDYRVSPAEYRNLETVYSADGLDERVRAVLEELGGSFTVLLNLPDAVSPGQVEDSLARICAGDPNLALGDPKLEVTYYPENARRTVAEVKVTYPDGTSALRARYRSLVRAAEEFANQVGSDAAAIYDGLLARCTYDPQGGNTAYDALLENAANDEGLARAFVMVCDLKGIPNGGPEVDEEGWFCTVEVGEDSLRFTFVPSAEEEEEREEEGEEEEREEAEESEEGEAEEGEEEGKEEGEEEGEEAEGEEGEERVEGEKTP